MICDARRFWGRLYDHDTAPARGRELLPRHGLDPDDRRPVASYSQGMRQRVAVARALANHPKLVLADEPTGNLDTALATETLGLLRETCAEQRAALLLVSHDRDILAQFERVTEFAELNQTP